MLNPDRSCGATFDPESQLGGLRAPGSIAELVLAGWQVQKLKVAARIERRGLPCFEICHSGRQ